MMGHREQMKGGGEYDYLTKRRRHYGCRPGTIQWHKRKFNKRVRHDAKAELRSSDDE